MKHIFLTLLCCIHITSMHAMQEVALELHELPTESTQTNQPTLVDLDDAHNAHTYLAPATFFRAAKLVSPEAHAVRTTSAASVNVWKQELADSIKNTQSHKLIALLSQDSQPQQMRGFEFKPYTNALEQIQDHKQKEENILTNTPAPDTKYFKCCNITHVWNRTIAPGIIIIAKTGQIVFAAWGIYRAASIVLREDPLNYTEAAANAAPAIGSIISALGDLPFSIISAWRRRILKTQQAKYEYYVLAENNVKTQNELLRLVQEIHAHQLDNPHNEPNTALMESNHNNNNATEDLEKAFNGGTAIGSTL